LPEPYVFSSIFDALTGKYSKDQELVFPELLELELILTNSLLFL